MVFPVGNGSLFIGTWIGFSELARAGLLKKVPRMHCVQPQAVMPVVAKYRGEIFALVKQINAAGTPILMVEQNAPQALAIAARGYVLVDGRNRIDDSGPGLLANLEVAEMFLGG